MKLPKLSFKLSCDSVNFGVKSTNMANASSTPPLLPHPPTNLTSKVQNNRRSTSIENKKEKKNQCPWSAVPEIRERDLIPLLREVPHPAQAAMGKGE